MPNALTPLYTGPLEAAAQSRDCAALLAAVNDRSGGLTRKRLVTVLELTVWAAPSIRGKLEDARLNTLNAPLRSIALAAMDLLGKPFDTTFDTVKHASLLDALQAGNVISGSERTALDALSTEPISPAEQAMGRPASIDDIWESLK